MKMVKKFSEYTRVHEVKKAYKKPLKKMNENVMVVGDNFQVKTTFDVPKTLIKDYVDKIKEETGKNPLEMWGAADIAEQMVIYTLKEYLKLDNIPSRVLVGDATTKDEKEVEAEDGDIEITETEVGEDDFTQDKKVDAEVEEETSFGMSNVSDNDIKEF